ncbi:hypothetical protein [Nocardia sp. NPDC051750]|jgi:hypothetical protein|uniref:hypothetical protein n=1 Tax=Nocardia sp. NPDC051750 TaxID=3364325 RepID=UPI00379EF702
MTRLLSGSIAVAAIAIGAVAGAAQASAGTGLPLQPATNVTAPSAEAVQLPTAPGSSANEAQAMQQLATMLSSLSAA